MSLSKQYNGVENMRDRPDATQTKSNTKNSLANQMDGIENMTERPDAAHSSDQVKSEKTTKDPHALDFGSFKVTPR